MRRVDESLSLAYHTLMNTLTPRYRALTLKGKPISISVRLHLLMQILGRDFKLADLAEELPAR